jgi:hypothetical protein
MAHKSDWLPSKRTEILAMAKTWKKVLTAKGSQWGITPADVSELGDWIETSEAALAKAMSSERNAVINAECKEQFDGLIALMRNMKNRKFFSPPLSDPDFISLGLKPHDTIKTPIADPTGQAEADVTYPGPHLLMLHLKALSGTAVDHRADHGYRIYYGIMPHGGATVEEASGPDRYLMQAVMHGEDLPHSVFTRRKQELLAFPDPDSGKTAFFSIRYENAKGKKGPWGPVFSAIIP